MSIRSEYIAGLKVELENLSRWAESPIRQRRLAEVKSELDKYSEQPAEPQIETAEIGPISRARAAAARKPS